MSLERDIKDAFGRHAEDAHPSAGALGTIERKVARAHRRRLVAATAAGVAVLAAAVVVVPRVLPKGPQGFAGSGDPTVDTTATAQAVELKVFRNERDGYQVSIPKDWYVTQFEGNVELLPPNQMGRTAGDDGFSVELQHRIRESYDAPEGDAFEPTDDIGGRDAVRAEHIQKTGEREVVYRVNWTGANCPKDAVCDSEIATLRISILATTATLWDRFGSEGEGLVQVIDTLQNAPKPGGMVTTLYGSVDGDAAEYDEATQFVVRFMDARVAGDYALPFLTQEAEDQYSARKNIRFYTCCTPETPWQSYFVVQRTAADANSYVYLVELVSRDADGNEFVAHEELGVGRSGGGYEIRYSEIRKK